MKVQSEVVPGLSASLLDVDISEDGRVLILYGDETRRFVRLNEREIVIKSDYKPDRVRFIDDEFCLFTGDWADGYYATMYGYKGYARWGWEVSKDIEDVNVVGRWVVIGYGDIHMRGVLLLPTLGHSQIYYEDFFGEDAVSTVDCYALCKAEKEVLYFFPYTEFPLVRWDLWTMTQQVMPTPEVVEGSKAISVQDTYCYFYSPFDDEDFGPDLSQHTILEVRENNFYRWEIGTDSVQMVGEFPKSRGKVRGLPGGRFLVVEADSYSVISF